MTTLALSAVLAVALSISTTNDYHYVSIPTNMAASLTGVGMGAEVSSADAPLRYEDAAFLAEALEERREFFGTASDGPGLRTGLGENVSRPISETLYSAYYSAVSDKPIYHGNNSGYGDPDAEMWDGVRGYTPSDNAYDRSYLDRYAVVFSKTNWMELVDMTYADVTNAALRADYVARLYRYVSRATRPTMVGSIRSLSDVSHCTIKDNDYSQYETGYNSTEGAWEYGERDATNYVSTTARDASGLATFAFVETVSFSAERKKARGWKLSSDASGNSKWTDATGECDFYGTKSTQTSNRAAPMVFAFDLIASTDVCAALGSRKATAVYVYALGTFSFEVEGTSDDKAISGKPFAIRLPASLLSSMAGGVCSVDVGLPPQNEAIVSAVCSHFGVTPYSSASDLLADVPMPNATSADYSNYSEKYTSGTFSMSVYLSTVVAVFDVDFNARVLERN